jgi:DNA-binding transcriptional MerR regulator
MMESRLRWSKIATMDVRIGIGDFSRMTHLSVKALRHYHDVGLLDPAEVDFSSGYRYYQSAQVATAQVIRRFRDLGMPLDEIKTMLGAPDVAARNAVISQHLQRMESQLAATQTTVASLRTLLEHPRPQIAVEYRSVGPIPSLAITEVVPTAGAEEWFMTAFGELEAALTAAGIVQTGPRGALYPAEFFEIEEGEIVVYVPIRPGGLTTPMDGRVRQREIPAAELAIAMHEGSFADIDLTYGAVGTYVAEREIGVAGPIREHYVVSPFDTSDESDLRTEVGWPVFRTTPAS